MRYVLWDFDGTLANRSGMWSGALCDALAAHFPGLTFDPAQVKVHLSSGFPWHEPDVEHFDLLTADAWWSRLLPVFERATTALGLDQALVRDIAASTRVNYLDPSSWSVAEGGIEVLGALQRQGWRQALISNHVPELARIVECLGFAPYLDRIFCSALIGVEKPHPAFFNQVLHELGVSDEIWVIGDNVKADIMGAKAAGLRAILVGSIDARADHCVRQLGEIPYLLST